MAKQLFSNNATTTLSSAITNVATSISVVTGKGELFASPTGGDYELLTITDGTNYEIVKCTARSTDTLTVTRAQESTSARAWSAGATIAGYITKGTLEDLRMQGAGSNAVLIGGSATSTGDRSVAVGHSADATANYAIAVGVNSSASGVGGVVIGDSATTNGQQSVVIGSTSTALSAYSVSIGTGATSPGQGGVSLGYSSVTTGADSVAISSFANAAGLNGVAVGKSSTAGASSVAVGVNASGNQTGCVVIGNGANTNQTQTVAIGQTAAATGTNTISIGVGSAASDSNAVSIGASSVASGQNAVAVGPTAKGETTSGIAIGGNATAGGQYSVAIGESSGSDKAARSGATQRANSTAYSVGDIRYYSNYVLYCVKAGTSAGSPPSFSYADYVTDGTVVWYSTQDGSGGVAVGAASHASNAGTAIGYGAQGFYNGISLGSQAIALRERSLAIGLGSKALHPRSTILGPYATTMASLAIHNRYLPFLGAPPAWLFGSEPTLYTGLEGYLQSEPLDLAGGATWTATTQFKHGYVCQPTTPNGCQYVRYCNNYNAWDSPRIDLYSAGNTGSTEPTWGTSFGSSRTDGDGDWICVPHSGTYVINLTSDSQMMVSEVGFIAYDVSSVTVQPFISIGTGGADLTSLVNNQQTSGLTANNTVYKWSLSQPKIVQNLSIKIDTLATGTRLLGRFYFKGVLTRHWV